ncbi:MAG: prefoldin subunit alpha [Candidatus ainarchaeum sp.]|nr:prefoldin subunit alpha [Candidatus ainarchaeum sp.]
MADDSQRMVYEARVYSEQIRLLQNEAERINMTAMELESSLAAVEALREEQIFVPLGAGAMVSSRITSTEVLVPIGAGYMIGMKKYEAVEEIKKRMQSTQGAIEKLRAEFDKINAKLYEVSGKIDAMNAKRGGREGMQ